VSRQPSETEAAASQAFGLDPTWINEIADRVTDALVERVVEAVRAVRDSYRPAGYRGS
jgi:hypothetical protein